MRERTGPPVVLLGADCMTGLQAARRLAPHVESVLGVTTAPKSPFCRGRAFSRIVPVGPDPDEWTRTIDGLAASLAEKPVLLPCTDEAVRILDHGRDRLAHSTLFALPSPESLANLTDKSRSSTHAWACGLNVPETQIVESRADLDRVCAALRFPCIVKPPARTASWLAVAGGKVVRFDRPEELRSAYPRLAALVPALVVQEWIPGGDDEMYSYYGCFSADAEPLAHLVVRKLRQWPPDTGSGSLAVECDMPEIVAASERLLRRSGHVGLVSVQFKRDPRSGDFVFIETNVGRVALNMSLAELCGVELLQTFVCERSGRPLPSNRSVTRPGGKWIAWKLDLPSALVHARRGELGFVDWWRSIRGRKTYGLWSARDPLPFVLDLMRKLPAARRRLRRIADRRKA